MNLWSTSTSPPSCFAGRCALRSCSQRRKPVQLFHRSPTREKLLTAPGNNSLPQRGKKTLPSTPPPAARRRWACRWAPSSRGRAFDLQVVDVKRRDSDLTVFGVFDQPADRLARILYLSTPDNIRQVYVQGRKVRDKDAE